MDRLRRRRGCLAGGCCVTNRAPDDIRQIRSLKPLTLSSDAPPRFRHYQPDHGEAQRRDARKPGESDTAAELVADVAGEHGTERCADTGCRAYNPLRKIEVAASECDVGYNQRYHDAEHGRGDA